MSIHNDLDRIAVGVFRGIAKYGMRERLDVGGLLPAQLSTIYSACDRCSGKGDKLVPDFLDSQAELEIYESVATPGKEVFEGLVAKLVELLDTKRMIQRLTRVVEDLESGEYDRTEYAFDQLDGLTKERYSTDSDPEHATLPDDEISEQGLIDRSENPSTGTVFDTWTKLGAGEIGVIVARPKCGKSSALVDLAAGYAENNTGVVLYFSEEMSKIMCATRLNRRIAHSSKPTVIRKAWKSITSKVVVESHPTYTATVEYLEQRARHHREQTGLPIVAIIVDYLALCRDRQGSKNGRYDELSQITLKLRGMAGELGCPVWTACQPTRGSSRDSRWSPQLEAQANAAVVLGMEDVSECWAIPQVADYLVSLNQTREERAASPPQVRVHVAAVRDPDPNAPTADTLGHIFDYEHCCII